MLNVCSRKKNHTTAQETRHGVNIGVTEIRLASKVEMKSYNNIHSNTHYSLNSLFNQQQKEGESMFY